MKLVLKACRDADVKAVLALWARAGAEGALPDTSEGVRRRLERDRSLFLLAWDGSRLVGSLIGGWDGWRGNMYRLAVLPKYRRLGVATELVAAVEARLWKLGARRVTSLVLNRNVGGRRLWEAAGYHRDATIGRYVKNLG